MTEFSSSWWNKNKAKTLKSTGLGDELQRYEAALAAARKAATSELKHESLALFDTVQDLLDKTLPAAIERARAACNKTLHKDTLAALDAYKSKLLPKAAADFVNLRGRYEDKFATLARDFQQSCDTLFQLSGDTLDTARDALANAERAVAACDTGKMKMIELLSRGPSGAAAARTLLTQIRAGATTVTNLQTAAAQSLARARAEVRTKFIYRKGILPPGKDNLTRMADKIGGNFDAAEMAIEKIKPLIEAARDAAEEGQKLLDGAADTSAIYLKSAERAAAAATRACDMVEGAARSLGGDCDGLKFRLMNATEAFAKDRRAEALLAEVKAVAGGVAAQGQKCATLLGLCRRARADATAALDGFPKFVREDRDAFGTQFAEIDKALDGIEDAEEATRKAQQELVKIGRGLQEATAAAAGR